MRLLINTYKKELEVKKAVITTSWDDGSIFDLKLKDLLKRYSIPATFYVPVS